MTKTRVVNIITDMNIGGAGKVLENFYTHCNFDEFEHFVVVPMGSKLIKLLKDKKVRVIAFEHLSAKSFSLKSIKPLSKLIKKIEPNIVHTHASLSARIAASSKKNVKVIYTRHCVFEPSGFAKSFIGRLAGKTVFSLFADRVIAISPASMKNLTATGIPGNKIDVLMNGVNPLRKMSPERIAEAKSELGIGQSDFVFTMLGRLEDIKGHRYFLNAAAKTSREIKDVKFMIVGEGSMGSELRRLSNNIEDDVIFTGFMKNVSKVLNVSDVLVNASYGTEASSMAIIEAMSLGKPVIASDYGGNPYQVEDNITGLIVPVKDSEKMAEAMILLSKDTDLYSELSKNASLEFKSKFTAAIMAGNIEEIYRKLVKKDV